MGKPCHLAPGRSMESSAVSSPGPSSACGPLCFGTMAEKGDATSNFLAGAVAGGAEVICVQPLDALKTQLQLAASKEEASIPNQLRKAWRAGGGPSVWYRGIVPELVAGVPKSSVMFSSYTEARRVISSFRGVEEGRDVISAFAAGAVSGVPEAVVVTPFQLVKVRLQAIENMGKYSSSWQCCRSVLAEEGPRALFTGLNITILRNSIWNSVYFASFTAASTRLSQRKLGPGETLGLGFVCGVLATFFNAPLDLLKSRVQASTAAGERPGLVRTLLYVASTEGPAALWRGWGVKAARMGIGGAVALAVFEGLTRGFKDMSHLAGPHEAHEAETTMAHVAMEFAANE